MLGRQGCGNAKLATLAISPGKTGQINCFQFDGTLLA